MNGKTALGLDANVGALLCYLPICLISLVFSIIVIATDKDNKAVRFHAFQSLLLTVLYVVLAVVLSIVSGVIAAAVSPTIGSLFSLVTMVVALGFLVLMIIGCIKGFTGGSYKLPIIGDMAEKWS